MVLACALAVLGVGGFGMSSYVIKAKAGAIVRTGIELDSTLVATLAKGTKVTVEEKGVSSKQAARCRVVAAPCGTKGWLSEKMLEACAPEPARKLRVALLHGTAANAAIFQIQLGPYLVKLKEVADVYFVDGPKLIDPENPQAQMMKKFFGPKQILREFANATTDDRGWRTYDDLDAAIDGAEAAVDAACGGSAPDALLCFSQGSNFGTMLASRAERRGAPYKALVLLCGARPGWVNQLPKDAFEPLLETPALVGSADKDTVVEGGPAEIAKLFKAPETCSHKEGHRPLPADKAASTALQATISEFLSRAAAASGPSV